MNMMSETIKYIGVDDLDIDLFEFSNNRRR